MPSKNSTSLQKILAGSKFNPITYVFYLFPIVACLSVACFMKGADQERTYKEIVFKGTKLYIAEWAIWPPAQFIVSLCILDFLIILAHIFREINITKKNV